MLQLFYPQNAISIHVLVIIVSAINAVINYMCINIQNKVLLSINIVS